MNLSPYSNYTGAYKAAPKKRKGAFDPMELAGKIRDELEKLPNEPASIAKVIDVFAAAPGTAEQKRDAFWLLDEKPGLFSGYSSGYWFSLLRRCRNHPVYGRAMFDAINNRY